VLVQPTLEAVDSRSYEEIVILIKLLIDCCLQSLANLQALEAIFKQLVLDTSQLLGTDLVPCDFNFILKLVKGFMLMVKMIF